MFMNAVQIILLFLISSLALLTSINDLYSSKQLNKSIDIGLFKFKLKRLIIRLSFLCIALIFAFQFINYTLQNNSEKLKDTLRLRRENGNQKLIISKFDSTISKADSALKGSEIIIDSLNKLKNDYKYQLSLQIALNQKATVLIKDDKLLSQNQRSAIDNINRIINPIFPLHEYLVLEIPFDNQQISGLVNDFITIYKNSITKSNQELQGKGIYTRLYNGHEVFTVFNLKKILTEAGYSQLESLEVEGWFTFSKRNNDKRSNYLDYTFKLNYASNNINTESVDIDPFEKKILIKYFRTDSASFLLDNIKKNNVNFGYNDLINSTMIYENKFLVNNYNLKFVRFNNSSGLIKIYPIILTEKDARFEQSSKIYIHKIKY